VGKDLKQVKLVTSGAGAAAIACLNLLVSLGMSKDQITVLDRQGVIYQGRAGKMDKYRAAYARETQARNLEEALSEADIFLGLSAAGILKAEMLKGMAVQPLILALANPIPEIMPEQAKAARPDAIIATGRSDYPNQVNNVLCFPYIFRGALDVGATTINEEMKLACVQALAELAQEETSDEVTKAYGGKPLRFGPDYLIPKPFDPRLVTKLSLAVAQKAMETGVATRPIQDFGAYTERLTQFVFRSGLFMKPVFERSKKNPKRLVFAEGEERRVLQAAQQLINESIAYPILIGRPSVIAKRIKQLGLRMSPGQDFELINILKDDRFNTYWKEYHRLMQRRGVIPEEAKTTVRTNHTVVAALALRMGDADAMLCGSVGRFSGHLQSVADIIDKRKGIHDFYTLCAVILPKGTFFICDSHISENPDAEKIADMTILAAEETQAFGVTPKIALLSRSNYGTHDSPSSQKMRQALHLINKRAPHLEIDGEMHADAALSEAIRKKAFPNSRLKGQANLLIMPDVESAHISFNLIRMLGQGVEVGPILLGAARPAHIVFQSSTVRGLVNMAAIAVAQAQMLAGENA
jgi:malate dehydrogenase (oxaloacetate-decarboxylating)(NADP+)